MKRRTVLLITAILIVFANNIVAQSHKKPFVNYDDYEKLVKEVKKHRAKRLLLLEAFIAKSKEPNTIILDTRSKEMYDLKHISGAKHLNFSDFTQANLDSIFRQYGNDVQILIYCNNNFENRLKLNLQDRAFITKAVHPFQMPQKLEKNVKVKRPLTLALNIPTYINLYGYGYKNVYELGELVDVNDVRISFEGTDVLIN